LIVFFGEIHVFLQFSWEEMSLLHIENFDLMEVFLLKTNSSVTGKKGARCFCLKHQRFFFERHICFDISFVSTYLDHKEPFSTLKGLICRSYSFQKLTQFLQGNQVVDAAASNINGFLWSYTCVLIPRWIGPYGTKWAFFHLETPKLQEVFLSITHSILTGKQCASHCSI
jgi:hypothetical protein